MDTNALEALLDILARLENFLFFDVSRDSDRYWNGTVDEFACALETAFFQPFDVILKEANQVLRTKARALPDGVGSIVGNVLDEVYASSRLMHEQLSPDMLSEVLIHYQCSYNESEWLCAYHLKEFLPAIDQMGALVRACLDKIYEMKPVQPSEDEISSLSYSLPAGCLAADVLHVTRVTYDEIIRCYRNRCFLAAIALCGRVIETLLAETYKNACGEDPDSKAFGLNAILNRLEKKGYDLKKDAIVKQMELIGLHRNKAVHGSIVLPTHDEARGVIHLTRDIMRKCAEHGRAGAPDVDPE